jgi:alpha-galactosidase
MAFVRYYERNEHTAANAWRRWYVDRVMPKADASGKLIEPFAVAMFAEDTKRPNSCGSVSEDHTTWEPTLEKLLHEKLRIDYQWIDAGWYPDEHGGTLSGAVENDWVHNWMCDWTRTGVLELDKAKWPGKTFAERNDECKRKGIKTMLWVESARVRPVDTAALERNYGFKREWMLHPVQEDLWVSGYLADLGNPDCLRYVTDKIIRLMDENGVDLYREDFNMPPAYAWEGKDRAAGENRTGMAENLFVQGRLKLWDDILAYCAKAGKSTFIDSCASGGGMNDLESMRRAVPLYRSDNDRAEMSRRLSYTTSLSQWLPFSGGGVMSDEKWPAPFIPVKKRAAFDMYDARASYLQTLSFVFPFRNPEMQYDIVRKAQGEWDIVKEYMLKDFYVLTPWRDKDCDNEWTAYMYFDRERDEGILQIFRMELNAERVKTLSVKGVSPDRVYGVTDFDGKKDITKVSGADLLNGVPFVLETPRSSAVFKIGKAR